MPKYWCVNFADDAGLSHGIKGDLWLMGYQYADDQNDSGSRKAAITKNWRRLKEVSAGDRFVAYLPGNRFYATATVRTPRRPKSRQDRTDSIDEYLKRGRSYELGYVYFPPSVVYENFTDEYAGDPVRIDVEHWENHVPDGVTVNGLDQVPPHELQKACFPITKSHFDRIEKSLATEFGPITNKPLADGMEVNVNDSVVETLERNYAKSQGFVLDSKLRKALEDHAMQEAKLYFKSQGYSVEDHSKGHPYDLLCTRKKEQLHVEVKGTQTNGDGIFLTSGEVHFAHANKEHMALFLLHKIKVSADKSVLTGGEKRVILPWDVNEGCLKPISFKYEIADEYRITHC